MYIMSASAPPLTESDEEEEELDHHWNDREDEDEAHENSILAKFRRFLARVDETCSKAVVVPKSWRNTLFWIEYSVNGYPWIIGSSLALVCAVSGEWPRETQHRLAMLNLGLLLDLIVVTVLKVTVQRPRPAYNIDDQALEAPIADEYSFPSGHSSRAVMLATMCAGLFPNYRYVAGAMSLVVALSRVAMGRHYLSDVIGGVAIGWLQGIVILGLPHSFTAWVRRILQ